MYAFLLVLFEIGWGIKFNFIGSISLSELFLCIYSPFFLQKLRISRSSHLKFVLYLYCFILLVQVVTEIYHLTPLVDSLRGVAVTIMSLLHLFFLIYVLNKKHDYIKYLIFGIVLQFLIIGPEMDVNDESVFALVQEDSDAKFLKFYVAPLLSNMLLLLSMFLNRRITFVLFVLISVCYIALGARSMGLILLLSAMCAYKINSHIKVDIKSLLVSIVGIMTVFYLFYVLYVNSVIDGNVSAGNSKQILSLHNPYNPFELLLYGRSDFYGALVAFSDSPFWGYGAWSKDVTGYYNHLVAQLHNLNIPQYLLRGKGMPMHSVVLGYGVMNGVFAMIGVLGLIVYFLKKGFVLLRYGCMYNYVISYFLIALLWTSLFSPISHFRNALPLYMAFIFISFFHNNKIINEKPQNHCRNRL